MKKGWTYKKLGEVGITQTGTTPSKSDPANYGDYIPFIRPAEISIDGSGHINYDSEIKLSEEGVKNGRVFNSGSILMVCIGSIGKLGYLEKDVSCNQQINVLTPKKEYNSKYIFYAMSNPSFQKESLMIAQGAQATLPIINKSKWSNLEIPIPPTIGEQKRIVERLDAAFAQIDELKANAEKQLAEARALFQKSLAKAMEPKEGWEEKTLGDICEIKSLLVDPTKEQYKKLLHVGGANIVSMTGELVDLKTAEDEQLTSGKFTFDINDVLYNKIRPYLIKVARPNFNGLCSADMYPLTPKESITRGYLYYVLISKDFTEYAILNSGRAGMPKVNRQALFAYKCSIPSIKEQQRIVERLDSISENVRKYEEIQQKIIAECDALKQALLRQVFE